MLHLQVVGPVSQPNLVLVLLDPRQLHTYWLTGVDEVYFLGLKFGIK